MVVHLGVVVVERADLEAVEEEEQEYELDRGKK